MKKTIRTANLFLIILLAIAIFLAVFLSLSPVRIRMKTASALDQIDPLESFTFQFSHPVNAENVEQSFQISPQVNGKWTWISEQQALWQPDPALASGKEYQISFDIDEIENAVMKMGKNPIWTVHVRQAQILALKEVEHGTELYLFSTGENPTIQQLTYTKGKVVDFSPSANGEWIIVSVSNEKEGFDLWRMNRQSGDFERFLDCGADQCLNIDWAPNDYEFAFSRYDQGAAIWLADNQTGEVSALFDPINQNNSRPLWSPDGSKLAYWDDNRNKVIVYDFQDHLEYVLDGEDSYNSCWSNDSQRLFFTVVLNSLASYQNTIQVADIEKNQIYQLTGTVVYGEGISYNSPACNPGHNILALTSQANIRLPGRQLLLLQLNTMQETLIEDSYSSIPANLSWSLDGSALLYQKSSMGSLNNEQSVWISQMDGSKQQICDDCYYPKWLP